MDRPPFLKLQGLETVGRQENQSTENKEEKRQHQRVIFNAGEITVVRRPGEGSRPLFDREEIKNHERMSDEERRRCRRNFAHIDSGLGERRTVYDSHRSRSFHRERFNRARCGRRCPNCCPTRCDRASACFSDDEEIYNGYYGNLYRTRSDERILRDHSYLYRERFPSEIGYYHYEDPGYYEVVGNLVFHPSLNYCYYTNFEY